MLGEVAFSELLHDLAAHHTVHVAIAYKLVPAFSRWCEEERDSCPEDDAAHIADSDQIASWS